MPEKKKLPNVLELTPEELSRVRSIRQSSETILKVSEEQMFIAEFGIHFGFEGIRSILRNEIDMETAAWLMVSARKVGYAKMYENSQAAFIGAVSARSKRPGSFFESATKKIKKLMKADF